MTQNAPSLYVKYLQADRLYKMLKDPKNEVNISIEDIGMSALSTHPAYSFDGKPALVKMSVSRGGKIGQLAALDRLMKTIGDPMAITSDNLSTRVVGMSSTGVVWKVHFFRLETGLSGDTVITIDELKEALDVHE